MAKVSSANLQNLYLEILDISGSNAKSMENLVFRSPHELIYVLQRNSELNFWL